MGMLEIECDHVSLGFAFGPYIEEFRIGIGEGRSNAQSTFTSRRCASPVEAI